MLVRLLPVTTSHISDRHPVSCPHPWQRSAELFRLASYARLADLRAFGPVHFASRIYPHPELRRRRQFCLPRPALFRFALRRRLFFSSQVSPLGDCAIRRCLDGGLSLGKHRPRYLLRGTVAKSHTLGLTTRFSEQRLALGLGEVEKVEGGSFTLLHFSAGVGHSALLHPRLRPSSQARLSACRQPPDQPHRTTSLYQLRVGLGVSF